MVNPAVELNVPPAVPVKETLETPTKLEQKGLAAYEIVALFGVVIVTEVVATTAGHPLAAAIV